MKILLHACCAPCLIYPFQKLQEKGIEADVFFYNPNIHPEEEFEKRKTALEDLRKTTSIKVIYPPYDPKEYYSAVHEEPRPARCHLCWALRLKKTAQAAKEFKYDGFSSTLLVSPHQDHEALRSIGEDVAKEAGVPFYYEDFRPGYPKAREKAKILGIYRQKYCGCIFSLPPDYPADRI